MSRLIVKNLPKTVSEDKLKKEFAKQGCVTDCQLKYTKDGVFRKFAFIGFTTDQEADNARSYFDQTYIGTSKIQVEVCRALGDASKPRSWSKYAKDSSAYLKAKGLVSSGNSEPMDAQKSKRPKAVNVSEKKKAGIAGGGKDLTKDPKWAEFLELNTAGSKQGEDTAFVGGPMQQQQQQSAEGDENKSDADDKEDPLLTKLKEQASSCTDTQAIFIKGLPPSVKVGSLKEFLAPVRLRTGFVCRSDKPEKGEGDGGGGRGGALLTFNRPGDLRRVLKRNGEFFGGFKLEMEQVELAPAAHPQKNDSVIDEGGEGEGGDEDDPENGVKAMDEVAETGRIFVKNLSFFVTEEVLEKHFRKYGEIAEVTIPVDRKTDRSKGYGLVTFVFPEHAVKAFAEMDGTILQGRMLHLIPGKEKPGNDTKPKVNNPAASSFQKEKQEREKASASSSHNWNALFLGSGTVADVLADQLGMDKQDILTSDGGKRSHGAATGSVAVRMALGETNIVRETKRFLMQNGVSLNSFRSQGERSKLVILAKNLPAGTNVNELKEVFGKFGGDLGRIVLPPSGISALIEFLEPTSAKKAFKAVAYSRFKDRPFFLEWAPEQVFSGEVEDDDGNNKHSVESTKTGVPGTSDSSATAATKPGGEGTSKTSNPTEEEEEEEMDPEPSSCIFVKNLNFETNDEALRRKFEPFGSLAYANVAMKPNKKRPNVPLSMGYGFVQYYRAKDAQEAIKTLQGALLHNHAMELKISHRDIQNLPPSASNDQKSFDSQSSQKQGETTKILIRNIPFQATEDELKELFSTFGDLRFLRLPRKVGQRKDHRGFGFVDFTSKSSAASAFKSLSQSTHLYGRRLVLEWAKGDETIEDIRKRTAEHFTTGENRAEQGKAKRRIMDTLEKAVK